MQIFGVFLISMFLFFILGIVLPFVIDAPSEAGQCSTMSSFAVYGAYGGFMALSTLLEGVIPGAIKSILRPDSGATHLICNRYLLVKYW